MAAALPDGSRGRLGSRTPAEPSSPSSGTKLPLQRRPSRRTPDRRTRQSTTNPALTYGSANWHAAARAHGAWMTRRAVSASRRFNGRHERTGNTRSVTW